MKNILIYSIPFGYGPTGKAIAIANELSICHNVTLTSFNHSLQIIGSNNKIKILNCGSRDFSEWGSEIFQWADLLISVMDFRLINFVAKYFPQIKTIFVDSLFWWRKSLSDIIFQNCDLFILQTFPGVKEKIEEIPEKYRDKFIEVSPILSDYRISKYDVKNSNNIILHFGGVNSLIAQWEMYKTYFKFITSITINYATTHNYELTITGNSDLVNFLNDYFQEEKNIYFLCLDNKKFHKKLSEAKLFISTCGIEATYEAFSYQTLTIFLPPVNSTQLYQLMSLISLQFPVVISENLIDNFKKVITAKYDYHTETMEIAKTLEHLISKISEKIILQNCLLSFIKNLELSNKRRQYLLMKQNKFLNKCSKKWIDVLMRTDLLK